ncbi:hypothetical protein [Frateuria soli]|uniref:hypothetical protein n=1 Tax=Frateuria soli TaxID=1542730 RepID=UPI001E3C948C|nr:hypothetical protein [Frateuria soli]UGB39128.1 hypothetical protein LQ771_04590 [Frateuria soli]
MSACTLVACTNPLQPSERMFAHVPAGQTLAQMLGENASHSLSVEVGGYNVPRQLWGGVRPKPGQTIHATNYPQGGQSGSKYTRLALTMMLMYFTYGQGGWAESLAGEGATASTVGMYGAGIMAIGQLAITPMIGHAREVRA